MNHLDLNSFLLSLFADLHQESIPFCILGSSTGNLADTRDIDIACEKHSISRILPFLILSFLNANFQLNRIIFRSYCVQLFFLLPSERIIHIDLMYYFISGFNRTADAQSFIQNSCLVNRVPFASPDLLASYNNLKKYFSCHKARFLTPLSKPQELLSIASFRFNHLVSCFFVQSKRIAILGVDGAGKSTISKIIIKQLALTLRGPVNLYYLFRGVFPRYRTSINSSANCNPHSTLQRPLYFQLLKLLYMLFELAADKILCLYPQSWSVFDRYSYDLYLDRVRYGLSALPLNMLKQVINLVSVQPIYLFVLYGDSDVLYNRKKEIPLHVLEELLINYTQLSFGNLPPCTIAVNTSRYDIKFTTSIISSILNTHIALIPWE